MHALLFNAALATITDSVRLQRALKPVKSIIVKYPVMMQITMMNLPQGRKKWVGVTPTLPFEVMIGVGPSKIGLCIVRGRFRRKSPFQAEFSCNFEKFLLRESSFFNNLSSKIVYVFIFLGEKKACISFKLIFKFQAKM